MIDKIGMPLTSGIKMKDTGIATAKAIIEIKIMKAM